MFINNVRTHQGVVGRQVEIDKFPDCCPLCHHALQAEPQGLAHLKEEQLEIVFRCPREKCQYFFIARYFIRYSYSSQTYWLSGCYPWEPVDLSFSDSIKAISPDFCAIADQAHKAEEMGWKLVAGPGYRKALEFLIKDYLSRSRPADAENIKNALLGNCIANYVANDKVKATAARATWLGNDETHYLRKWEDKDLGDLKKLIDLTVHWIEMEELTDSFTKEMPEGKR